MSTHQTAAEVKERFIRHFPEGAGELAHWLWNDISHLHMNWNNYRLLFGTDQQTIDLLNSIAASFFAITERVLRHDTILRICRITDRAESGRSRGQANASLRQLAGQVAPDLPEGITAKLESFLDDLDTLSKPIRRLRNKRIAHSDFAVVLEYTDESLGVSRKQVQEVLTRIRTSFSLLEEHYLDSTSSFEDVIQANDAKKLLHHLNHALRYQEIEKIILDSRFRRNL